MELTEEYNLSTIQWPQFYSVYAFVLNKMKSQNKSNYLHNPAQNFNHDHRDISQLLQLRKMLETT